MAKNRIPYYTEEGAVASLQLTTSSTAIFTPGADGAKILGITLITTAAAARTVSIYVNNGSVDQLIFEQTISDVGNIDVFENLSLPKISGGTKYFNLPSSYAIKAKISSVSGAISYVAVVADNY